MTKRPKVVSIAKHDMRDLEVRIKTDTEGNIPEKAWDKAAKVVERKSVFDLEREGKNGGSGR